MITQESFDELVIKFQPLQDKLNEFKEYLTSLNLTFQSSYDVSIFEFKTNQFAKLLATDKGLAMEYNTILKSPQAKADKVNSKIVLTGWDEPVKIKQFHTELFYLVKAFNEAARFRTFDTGESYSNASTSELIDNYEGSVSKFLEQFIIDWTGLEDAKQMFVTFCESMNKINELYRKAGVPFLNSSNQYGEMSYSLGMVHDSNTKFVGIKIKPADLFRELKKLKSKN